MKRRLARFTPALAIAATLVGVGCATVAHESASFERTLSVTGPVRLDLSNGSGSIRITGSTTGQVRIHGDIRRRAFFLGHTYSAQEVANNPPIEQQGNTIRIGDQGRRMFSVGVGGTNLTIEYVIEVPKETEIETRVGSGSQPRQAREWLRQSLRRFHPGGCANRFRERFNRRLRRGRRIPRNRRLGRRFCEKHSWRCPRDHGVRHDFCRAARCARHRKDRQRLDYRSGRE